MQFKTLAFVASLTPAALADFKVFCGESCNGFDSSGCGLACYFFSNPPSCGDLMDSVPFFLESDVSGCGGVACDGCEKDEASRDWDITRLEIANQQSCSPSHLYWDNGGDDPHFTIYNKDGDANILDVDGKNVGTCVIPKDAQQVDCGDVFGNTGLTNHFDCTSDLVFKESPN
ncbi:hypothetical protein ACO1O0_003815 [Amphichorda felina]